MRKGPAGRKFAAGRSLSGVSVEGRAGHRVLRVCQRCACFWQLANQRNGRDDHFFFSANSVKGVGVFGWRFLAAAQGVLANRSRTVVVRELKTRDCREMYAMAKSTALFW